MRVIACLPRYLEARLRAALCSSDDLVSVACWTELLAASRQTHVDVLVADPRDIPPETVLSWGSIPLVVYTGGTKAAITCALPWARAGAWDIVLEGAFDSPRLLRASLERAAAGAIAEQLLARMEASLARMPVPAAQSIRDAVRVPAKVRSVQQLAVAAGLSPLALRRWTDRVGLATPKTILLVARVAWAYQQLRMGSRTVKAVAEHLAEHQRHLARTVRAITGHPPSELPSISPTMIIDRLVRCVCLVATICEPRA